MTINSDERKMYAVIQSIYESDLPISFKGSMVLKACLLEMGYVDEVRHTVDIDGNWNTNYEPTMEEIQSTLQKAIDKCGLDLIVKLYRPYGNGRSAGFEFIDKQTDVMYFSMDMDVNRSNPQTKIYEIEGIHFCGVSPNQMIADKICAVSTDKVFRRIKDVIDLYYFSKVFDFNKDDIIKTLNDTNKTLDNFDGFLHRKIELEHSYNKFIFRGCENKPPFEEVYSSAKEFIKDILPDNKQK